MKIWHLIVLILVIVAVFYLWKNRASLLARL